MRKAWFTMALLCLAAGCAGGEARRLASQVRDKPAQDFELTAVDGAKVKLSDHRGKPVVLAFFAYG